MKKKFRNLRAENIAKSKSAGIPVGEFDIYAKMSAAPKKRKRTKGPRVAWLNGRPVTSDAGGHRRPGCFEKGKRK